MKYMQSFLLVAALAVSTTMWLAVAAVGDVSSNVAITPTSRSEPYWLQRFQAINARVKQGNVDLIFIGDSITQDWETVGAEVWKKYYGKRNAVNLAISSDQTQNVLWRLDHGNIDGISPKLAVVLIGTNNSGNTGKRQPAEVVAEGIKAVVERLRAKLPETKILLLAIFPCGPDENYPFRRVNNKVNRIIAKLADGKSVFFLDIGPKFMAPDGTLTEDVMPYLLHLSAKSFKTWAEAIEPMVAKLMGEKP